MQYINNKKQHKKCFIHFHLLYMYSANSLISNHSKSRFNLNFYICTLTKKIYIFILECDQTACSINQKPFCLNLLKKKKSCFPAQRTNKLFLPFACWFPIRRLSFFFLIKKLVQQWSSVIYAWCTTKSTLFFLALCRWVRISVQFSFSNVEC